MAMNAWLQQQPTKSVVIKELPPNLTEPQLASTLNILQANFDDIRIIPPQGPGGTRQAYVEFISVTAAKEWMENQKGTVSLNGRHRSVIMYSAPAAPTAIAAPQQTEPMWECVCGALNVERRVLCFKCGNPQPSTAGSVAPKAVSYPGQDMGRERAYPARDRLDPYNRNEDLYRAREDPYRARDGPYRPIDDPYRQADDPFRERDMYRSRPDPYMGAPRRDAFGAREEALRAAAGPHRDRAGPPRLRDDPYGERREMGRPDPDPYADRAEMMPRDAMRSREPARMAAARGGSTDERDGRPLPGSRTTESDGRYMPASRSEDNQRGRDRFGAGKTPPGAGGREGAGLMEKSRTDNVTYPVRGVRGVSPPRGQKRPLSESAKGAAGRKDDGYPIRGVSPPASRNSGRASAKPKYPVFAPNTAALSTGRSERNGRYGEDNSSNGYSGRDTIDRENLSNRGAGDRPTPVADGSDQLGPNPCNTVLLRGLDGLSDERRILDSLADVTSLTPTKCYVMRNLKSNVSLGYAFMEFDSVSNGKKVVEYFNSQQSFEVDGKLLLVDFAKNTYKTIMAGIQMAREKYSAEQPPAPEVDKHKIFAAEQQMKMKEIELERQKMERRDLELRQQQEIERKKAEEREKEVLRINQEKAAREKEEKDLFNAKFGVEAYTGYTYEQDTGLYTEKGQFMPERCCFVGHSMANNLDLRIFDEKEIVPNGKLDDLVTAAVKLFDSPTMKTYRTCCYLFFGITDLLDVKQGPGYREVVLRTGGDALLISKIDWAVKTLKQKGVMVVLCTFPPMSFQKHNQFLLKNGLTGKLECKAEYQAMQSKHNEQVCNINRKIEELNCDSGVVTCQLSAKLFVQERGRYILKDVYLRDGLHPTSQGAILLNVELAQNLRKSKQGKRSPEWLKKSHQVKSGSKISFGIKLKKDDPVIPSVGKVTDSLDGKQDPTAATSSAKPASERRYYNVLPSRSPTRRRSRSPRRRSRSPRRRSRSPKRHSRSPRRRSRSPRRHSRSPRRWSRSPRRHRPSDGTRNRRDDVPSAVPTPIYKAVPVPKPLPEPEEKPDQSKLKQLGSFTLSGILGALTGAKGNDSESDASMSMSPPGPEPDPDIVIADTTVQTRRKPVSPARRYGRNDYRQNRSHSRSHQRHHASRRRSMSRSRSRRRSEDRFESKSNYYPQSAPNNSSRDWNRRKDEQKGHVEKAAKFESRFSDQPPSLLGARPSSLLGKGPETASQKSPDDHLVKLAKEQHELTGSNSFGQLKTLSHLNQLSGVGQTDALSQALELQKQALAQKMSGNIEQQKDKISKMLEAEKKKSNNEFDKIFNTLQGRSAAGSDYGYGLASQFQSGSSQFANVDTWNSSSQEETGYSMDDMAQYGDGFSDAYGGLRDEASRGQRSFDHRGGYGGYE